MDVSVIIVNWNTRDILRDCLQSIFEETRDITYEVIVIDNASSDGSVEMVAAEFPQVQLIANRANRGFASANNQGLAVAGGRYVLLLNSDTVVLANAIAKAARFADSHPDAAAVGCRVLNPDRTLQRTCFMFPSILNIVLSITYLYKMFPGSEFFGREKMSAWQRDDVREVEVVTGCFMLVRKEAIQQAGLMDEGYFMYAEEADWCWRFKRAGWRNLFTPEAQIIHLGGQSSKQVASKMTLQLRASILRFFRKNRSYPEYVLACLGVAFWFGIRVPMWLLMGVGSVEDRRSDWDRAWVYTKGAVKSLGGWESLSCEHTLRGMRL